MKRQPYLPDDDAGILAVLIAVDTNLPGPLATKYEVPEADLLRLRHGRHAFEWFVAAKPIAQQWSKSLTDKHDAMTNVEPAPLEALPGLPVLPPVPTFQHGGQTVTAQLEPGFFDFFGRVVSGIKNHEQWDEADGLLLKILGAQLLPPDDNIVPVVKWRFAASGRPILIVKKGQFQGYSVWVQRGSNPVVDAGFSTTREYELDHVNLPMPAPGQMEMWKVQVQYRYRNQPFGQKSTWVEIPVRGV